MGSNSLICKQRDARVGNRINTVASLRGRPHAMGTDNVEDENNWAQVEVTRTFRVEHRPAGSQPVVIATIRNVFPHHDTLTQYVSRLLNERGEETLRGELVLIDDATGAVLARRDLYRACSDSKRGRQRNRRTGNG